jgi:phage shock protein C
MEQNTDTTFRIDLDKDATAGATATGTVPPGADPMAPPVLPFPYDAAGAPPPASDPAPRFRLRRSRSDRMLGGVCGGVAADLDIDPALLRIGLVALTVLGFGAGAVLYAAVWILAPEIEV